MTGQSGKLAVKLAVALVLAGIALPVGYGPLQRHLLGKRFPPKVLREYEALFDPEQRPTIREGAEPCRTGKVVVVVPGRWQVYRLGTIYSTRISAALEGKKERLVEPPMLDRDFFRLDSSIRASSPDEVDTVIICEYGKQKVGHYVSEDRAGVAAAGGAYAAYRRCAILYVYDRRSGDFIGSHTVWGRNPPMETTDLGAHSGEPPDVLGFVEEMPLR